MLNTFTKVLSVVMINVYVILISSVLNSIAHHLNFRDGVVLFSESVILLIGRLD